MLRVEDLMCVRENQILFSKLTFEVDAGMVMTVVGANGAGKSSLLRILAGLLMPIQGRIRWNTRLVVPLDPEFLSDLLYIGHKTGVQKLLTPLENLASFGVQSAARWQALRTFGLQGLEEVPCQFLSAGQRQKVALARLGLQHARLWILDEPFNGLDEAGCESVQTAMEAHLARGGVVVMTHHGVLRHHQEKTCVLHVCQTQ